jgi:hypothetical protein
MLIRRGLMSFMPEDMPKRQRRRTPKNTVRNQARDPVEMSAIARSLVPWERQVHALGDDEIIAAKSSLSFYIRRPIIGIAGLLPARRKATTYRLRSEQGDELLTRHTGHGALRSSARPGSARRISQRS